MKKIIIVLFLIAFCSGITRAITIPIESSGGTSVGFVDMDKIFSMHPKYIELKQELEQFQKEKSDEFSKSEKEIKGFELELSSATDGLTALKKELAETMMYNPRGMGMYQAMSPAVNMIPPAIPATPAPVVQIITSTASAAIAITTNTAVQVTTNTAVQVTTNTAVQVTTNTVLLTTSTAVQITTNTAVQITTDTVIQQPVTITDKVKSKQDEINNKEKEIEKFKDKIDKAELLLEQDKQKFKQDYEELEKTKTLVIMTDFYKVIENIAKEENIAIVVEKTSILYGITKIDLTETVRERIRNR